MTDNELDELAKQDSASRPAMKSSCGEYECPCHDKLPILVAEIRRLRRVLDDVRCSLNRQVDLIKGTTS